MEKVSEIPESNYHPQTVTCRFPAPQKEGKEKKEWSDRHQIKNWGLSHPNENREEQQENLLDNMEEGK